MYEQIYLKILAWIQQYTSRNVRSLSIVKFHVAPSPHIYIYQKMLVKHSVPAKKNLEYSMFNLMQGDSTLSTFLPEQGPYPYRENIIVLNVLSSKYL